MSFLGDVLGGFSACRQGGSLAPWKCEGKLQEESERFPARIPGRKSGNPVEYLRDVGVLHLGFILLGF